MQLKLLRRDPPLDSAKGGSDSLIFHSLFHNWLLMGESRSGIVPHGPSYRETIND